MRWADGSDAGADVPKDLGRRRGFMHLPLGALRPGIRIQNRLEAGAEELTFEGAPLALGVYKPVRKGHRAVRRAAATHIVS